MQYNNMIQGNNREFYGLFWGGGGVWDVCSEVPL